MSTYYRTSYSRPVEPPPVPAPYQLADFDFKTLTARKENLLAALVQKVDKIISAFRTCDFYLGEDGILINDPLNLANDLEETIKQFGFSYKQVNANLRGSSYVITDKIIDLLRIIGGEVEIKNERLQKANSELNTIISDNSLRETFDADLLAAVKEVKEKGKIVMMSNDPKENYQKINALRKFSTKINEVIKQANTDLRNGVIHVVNTRAKTMGYTVNKQVVGTRVRMTLEKR